MKEFEYINAKTIEEAVSALTPGKAFIIAGGTDIVGVMKDEIFPEYPKTLINLKTVSPGLEKRS